MCVIRKFFVLILTFGLLPLGLSAAAPDTDATAYERQIQLLGRQAALGHRLVRSMCFAQAGIDMRRNRALVDDSRHEISATLTALKEGDLARGIPAISNSNILTQLSSAEMVWKALDKKAAAFLSGEGLSDEEVLRLTLKSNSLEKLLRNVSQSLELKTSVDLSPEALMRSRMIITASDQSRLLQQAGKDACLIYLDRGTDTTHERREGLAANIETFDNNIFNLTFTRPAQSKAPAVPALEQAAFNTWQNWVGLEPLFKVLIAPSNQADLSILLPELSFSIEYMDLQLVETLDIFMAL
ncbi:type IV pili methyl-accepting chemotaxis transducer N-terminal domain-containing protein [uncultured Celeribacter sp.]|uniref:type IV pili methyl-accepting chemotaxis transducer N-terminal domain-containing protein n=1 Tax=uncultured Celeribacter sp. TaxID=1303376 RepID=UPI002AA8CC7F|nr:type IV pili methyl-accepting chemotaxis transducer N-terminal domain-containing protein [uncultured Celeribacter sp.]